MSEAQRRVTLTKAQRLTPAGGELIALLAELSDDGMVTREEMARLKAWLEVDRGVEFEACAFLYEVVDTIAADGEITEAELDSLALAIERVLPPETRKAAGERRKARLRALREQSIRERAEGRNQERAAKLALREQTRVLHRGNFIVAGSRRSAERREACEQLDEGEAVVLEREPDNRHDRNAILVLTAGGDELGYVPREDAKEMAPLLDEGCFVEAEIKKLLTETRAGIPLPIVGSTIRRTPIDTVTRAPMAAVASNVARSSEVTVDTSLKPTQTNTAPGLPVAANAPTQKPPAKPRPSLFVWIALPVLGGILLLGMFSALTSEDDAPGTRIQSTAPPVKLGERDGMFRQHKYSAQVRSEQAAVMFTPTLRPATDGELTHALRTVLMEIFGEDVRGAQSSTQGKFIRFAGKQRNYDVLIIKDEQNGIQGFAVNF